MHNRKRKVFCGRCRKSWERRHLRTLLKRLSTEELSAEGWKFERKHLVIVRCQICSKVKLRLPAKVERAYALDSLAGILNDAPKGSRSV